jgi:type II secretory pathway pseudopilin PulG
MRARTKVTEERGFTIIEVLAATLMLLAAAAAALTIITAGEHSSETGQRQTALLSVAQQQIEQIRQVVKQSGFDALAIATPTCSPLPGCAYSPAPDSTWPVGHDPTNPDDFINGYSTASPTFWVAEDYHNFTSASPTVVANSPSAGEPLMFSSSGGIQAVSTSVPAGSGLTATVWRYITQRTEVCVASLGSCATDSRRVVVAVRLNNAAGQPVLKPNTPVYLTAVIDRSSPSNAPNQGNGLRIGLGIS